MIFYFSGCGNSKFLAESLGERLQQELIFIPKAEDSYHIAPDEPLGFVFPVYSWAPPRLVVEFLRRVKLTLGGNNHVFMAVTCGDECGLTDSLFAKALQRHQGLKLNAAYSVQMPETYINLPGFKLDTPENAQRKIDAAKVRIEEIARHIARKEEEVDVVVGGASWIKSHPVRALFNGILISDKPFRLHDNCVGCGICEQCCPVGNIKLDSNGRPVWQHHCVGCMGCYHHCPQNAIHFGKQTIGKGQYFFKPKVKE